MQEINHLSSFNEQQHLIDRSEWCGPAKAEGKRYIKQLTVRDFLFFN